MKGIRISESYFRITLKIASIALLFGGIVRVFATRELFSVFMMDELWIDHAYFEYIYRVLGGFVILTGMIFYGFSINPHKYKTLIKLSGFGFLVIGIIMTATGFIVNLPLHFFFPDFVFSVLLGTFLLILEVTQKAS
jgi:hypothetical protein